MFRILSRASALVALSLLAAVALLPDPARAQDVIVAPNGRCVGVTEVDGASLELIDCANPGTSLAMTVDQYTYQGPIRVTLSNGTSGCLDAYRGVGGRVEAVGCDGTPEQNWDLSASFTNAGMGTCLNANRSGIYNANCDGSRRQEFRLQPMGAAVTPALPDYASTTPAGSFGSAAVSPPPAPDPNAGNYLSPNGGALVGNSGNTAIPAAGSNMQNTSTDGHGGIVAAGAGNLIGLDGGSLVGLDGGSLVAAGGGNATGGYGLQSVGDGYQVRIGSLCLDASGSTAVVQDCGSASRFQVAGSHLQVAGSNRCVDGWRGQYKVGREEDQSAREAVTVENCDSSQEQIWNAYKVQDGQFFIANARYPLCMDVDGGVVATGRAVLLWKCYDSARPQNQIFALAQAASTPAPAPAPSYTAPAVAECGDPWVTQAIREVTGRDPNGSGNTGECTIGNYNNGSWSSYEELKGYVRTRLTGSPAAAPTTASYRIAVGSLCLSANGSDVTVQDCSQATRFEQIGSAFKVAGTNSCIDGWRGQYKVGREEDQSAREAVRVESCDGSQEQNWNLYLQQGGGFFLKDARYGLCMDVDGGVIAPGRTVLLWMCYDGARPQNQIYALMN